MLAGRLRERILAEGPLTFAAFMEAALYDAAEGFYAGPPVGEIGHFVTSPHVSPAFGSLLAVLVEDAWRRLSRPARFAVIEAGAGDGTLARQILSAMPAGFRSAVRYVGVERGPESLRQLASALSAYGGGAHPSLDEVREEVGLLLANELLDNLPFHRVRRVGHRVVEILVGLDGERFGLVEGPPSSEEIERIGRDLPDGVEGIAPVQALATIDRLPALLGHGYALFIDYAMPPGSTGPHAVHGYRGQRPEADVLKDPGSRDITAGVDFEALAERARSLGLDVWGPRLQGDLLMSLGFAERDRAARAEQARATDDRRGVDAARAYSDRNAARLLVDPAGLGAFRALCIGIRAGAAGPPKGFEPG